MLLLFKIKFGDFFQNCGLFEYATFKVDWSLNKYIHFLILPVQELQRLGISPEDPRLKGTVYI